MHAAAPRRPALLAAAVGNFFEWLDFTLYGFFALAIGKTFFPADSPTTSLLLAMTTFGVGFVARPAGAIVFGRLADRRGRRFSLTLSFLLMGLATGVIAVAPSAAQAGLLGAVLVVLARFLQGFAAAGEVGAAAAMYIESCPVQRRGLLGSFFSGSTYLALVAGGVIGFAVYAILGEAATNEWGWRLAFLLGLAIVPVGFWLRLRSSETSEFLGAKLSGPAAHRDWRRFAKDVLVLIGLTAFGTSVVYLAIIFMPAYAQATLKLPATLANAGATAGALAIVGGGVVGGLLADRRSRRFPMIVGLGLALVLSLPLFSLLIRQPDPLSLFGFQVMIGFSLGLFVGGSLPLFVELFPVRDRALGIGLGYNLGVIIFGAAAPIASTYATTKGVALAPIYYMGVAALVSLAVTLLIREPSRAA